MPDKSFRLFSWCTIVVALFLLHPETALHAAPTGPSTALFSDKDLLNSGVSVIQPVVVSARIEARDTSKILVIVAELGPGWHLYSLQQKPGGPRPTKISVSTKSAYLPEASFVATPPPEKKTIDGVPGWEGLIVEEHAGKVTWTAPLEKNPQSEEDTVVGNVSLQLCKDNACTPPQTIPFSAILTGTQEDVTIPAIQHLPERGHVAIEGSVGPPTQSDNGCLAWPVHIELLPQAGWHLYAPKTDPTTAIGQGKPSIISLAPGGAVRVCEILANEPRLLDDPELKAAGAVEGSIRFTLQVEKQDASLSDGLDQRPQLEAIIGYQTCSDVTCDPPWASRLSITLPEGTNDSPKLVFSDSRYGEAAQHPAALTFPSQEKPQLSPVAQTAEPVPANSLSLPVALLAGLLGGLILNLMPCVLPVLGLKLMSFAQQSGRARQEIFQLNLWYCAGLYAVFFVLATASVAANLGLAGNNLAWGEQFTSSGFNITMAAIVFSFALSFLGVWELPIPGFIGSTAGKVQTQEGPAGSFFKGVLSTVLATPCSGPFLGPVFGFTLTQPTGVTYAVFAAIATGMALPYFIVGIFPSLIRFVPKPGPWMETLKEVLGFVMLGTVVFLFTFLDSNYFVPTFALLISIWIGCWWVGRYQKTKGMAGFMQWLQAAAVSVTLGTLVFSYLGPSDSVIDWEPFSKERLAELRSKGSTVMVDFSAEWCLTCKYNLAFAIETSRVKTAIEKRKVVPMLADWTDGSPEIKAMLESLNSKSIPVLAFFPPNAKNAKESQPIILRDLVTESQVLDAIEKVELVRPPVPDMRSRTAG
ncbi:MAG: hypothetical protein HN985_06150 [Planctomycetaceae bacterium]|nr:hypothetical protein [Planctomycetaceae bacterium]